MRVTEEAKYIEYLMGEGGVFAAYSTRRGGSETYPYANRSVFDARGVSNRIFVWPNQIHKTRVATVDEALLRLAEKNGTLSLGDATVRIKEAEAREGEAGKGANPLFEPFYMEKEGLTGIRIPLSDAVITNRKDVVLTTIHADCLAVYLYDPVHRAIGLCHAGWRGTVGGIAVKTLEAMRDAYGTKPNDVFAAISPGIATCCFQVGEEVLDAFREAYSYAEEYATRDAADGAFDTPRYHMDLKGLNARQLIDSGILPEKIEKDVHCTCCEPELFWSFRREKGCKERQGAILYLEG